MAEELTQAAPREVALRAEWRAPLLRALRTTLSVVALLALWSMVSALPWSVPIPSPLDSLRALLRIDARELATHMLLSCRRVGVGFVIAAALAIPLGILVGYSSWVRNLAYPLIEVLRPVPPIAWIPLAILFFPDSESMVVFLTFLGAFFPIVYNTIAGFSSVKPMYLRAAASLGASEWRLFWHVILPGMLPVVFAGLHVAMGVSWLMVVAGEMMAAKGGIGAMTWDAYQTARYALIFVGMALIGVLGFLTSVAIKLVGTLICRWESD